MKKLNDIEKYRAIPITTILGVRTTGNRQSIRCPVKKERTPSFSIYPDNSYHCFSCGAHGKNAVDFVMELGYSFSETLSELKQYL